MLSKGLPLLVSLLQLLLLVSARRAPISLPYNASNVMAVYINYKLVFVSGYRPDLSGPGADITIASSDGSLQGLNLSVAKYRSFGSIVGNEVRFNFFHFFFYGRSLGPFVGGLHQS